VNVRVACFVVKVTDIFELDGEICARNVGDENVSARRQTGWSVRGREVSEDTVVNFSASCKLPFNASTRCCEFWLFTLQM